MSKYIRTKDGRIVKINLEGDVFTSRYEIVGEPKDTIEELCDEFVIAYIDGYHQLTSFPSKIEVILGHSVYGAIWTNKGLLYVAKLNDKGELELI